jgi:hypothetical protein
MRAEIIFFPAIAMFFLTASVLARMGMARKRAVETREIDPKFYRLYNQGQEPPHLRQLTRHMQNHFELPPLFYAVILMLYVTGSVNSQAVITAWLFVALRALHTYVHLGSNFVPRRFMLFIGSVLMLTLLWLNFFITLVMA